MKAASEVRSVLLPIVRWTSPREPILMTVDSASIPELKDAEVVGEVILKGYADVGPRETIVHLTVDCKTREICGRSLEEFEADLTFPFTLLFRRKASMKVLEWEDDGEETYQVTVPEDLRELDITEVLRQSIELERPLSPVKPGVGLPEGALPEEVPVEEPVDPRWEALRKLKGP